MLIDLEEETRSADARNMSVPTSPPPSQDIHLLNQEIQCVGIVTEEASEHEEKDKCNIEIKRSSSEIAMEKETEQTENQKEDTASLNKRSIAEVDESPGKTDNVCVKMALTSASSPPPSHDIHLEKNPCQNEVDEAKSSEELMHLKVEEPDVIPGVVNEGTSEQEDNFKIQIETSSCTDMSREEEIAHTENQEEDTASLRKCSIAQIDESSGKTGNVGRKLSRITPPGFSVEDSSIAGNNMDCPDDDDDENSKFSEVTSLSDTAAETSHLTTPFQAIQLDKTSGRNEADEAESSEELMQLKVEDEEEISSVGMVTGEVSEHEEKDNSNIHMETSSSEISKEDEHTETQKEATVSLRKRSIQEAEELSGKTHHVGAKMASTIPSKFSVEGLPIAGNYTGPDDDNDENKKWFSEVTTLLKSKDDAALDKLLQEILNLSPGLLHGLVLQLKEENKLGLLTSISFTELDDDNWIEMYPLFHEIMRKINVEERTLDILSEAGFDFNVLDHWNRNALHSVIKGNQNISMLKSLMKRGANVKQTNSQGENLIHFALEKGCTMETLEVLVNEGVNFVKIHKPIILLLQNAKDPKRIFSLFKFLFNAGAHYPDTVLSDHYKSKYEKRLQHFRELFDFIFSNGKIGWFNTKNSNGATPLHLALGCWKMDEENLQLLANAQADFSIIDKERRGCLHYAIAGGNWSPKTLQFLIDKGARLTISKENRETLLHISVKNRAPWEALEFLLEKGVEIGSMDGEECTALDLVIRMAKKANKDEKIIRELFIRTFNAGIRYSRYLLYLYPILHVAIEVGPLEVVKHMLENGVNANELDSDNKTAFLKAIEEDLPDGVGKAKLLRRFGAVIPSEIEDRKKVVHNVAKNGTLKVLKYCIDEFELDVDATLANGKTLLHSTLFARIFYNSKLANAKRLILEGADVNAKPEAGVFFDEIKKLQSPLHLLLHGYNDKIDACSFLGILLLLLDRGANINEKSLEGWTALHILMNNSIMDNCSENFLEVAKWLVRFGADIRAKTKKGQSVLHIAAGRRSMEKIQFCLSEGLDVNALDIDGKTPIEYFLPGDDFYFSDESACQLENTMKVLLEGGATAKTKANLKEKTEERWEMCKEGSVVESLLEKFLELLE